jgi:hypothetical protein
VLLVISVAIAFVAVLVSNRLVTARTA